MWRSSGGLPGEVFQIENPRKKWSSGGLPGEGLPEGLPEVFRCVAAERQNDAQMQVGDKFIAEARQTGTG